MARTVRIGGKVGDNFKDLPIDNKSSFVRGQINVITTLLDETWDYKESGQSYFDFLKYLVNKYQLEGVWRIKDLS
ncbi:hypothetical protein P4V88_23355 [Bacillus thuringiensis]|uniref:hypothetical protein n=1 Tax=Bacillus thuringiensis TaxID=1428 RepID=UPI001298A516|nr:hypothetical protein [Bacillus thuringiensis]MED2127950.1 hypothetical protein [Bacillus thuringiensis]MED2148012.1 hypothetical protein [Bacillus thuringiensis]MED2174873.1 hypothetical protein [Bacillus thuringiensis]MED2479242.1 hypothetical protein [Bacillus thuringiensis]MED2576678.1 hypothetical protein [Bacillus thuringiensis]